MRHKPASVPEGHAYLTTNGGFAPPTCYLLHLPVGGLVVLPLELDPFLQAKFWLEANYPNVKLHDKLIPTL